MPLNQQIDQLAQSDEKYTLFVAELRRHAEAFNMKQICDLISPHLEIHDESQDT